MAIRKKVYMLPSWTGSAEHMMNLFIRQTPSQSGIWKDIEVTSNLELADFHVQMDKPKNPLVNPSKTIYMNWEPPNKMGHYLCDDYEVKGRILFKDFGFPCMWFLDYTYDELKQLEYPLKKKKISCVLSDRIKCEGHRIRHRFSKHMCDICQNDIDMYGSVKNLDMFKGILVQEANELTRLGKRGNFLDKTKTIFNYKYHLCMENSQVVNYFTEKITDALLMWSIPIYWGCPNIFDFFLEKSVITFDATNINEVFRIQKHIDQELDEQTIAAIAFDRHRILDEYNFCNILDKFIKENL